MSEDVESDEMDTMSDDFGRFEDDEEEGEVYDDDMDDVLVLVANDEDEEALMDITASPVAVVDDAFAAEPRRDLAERDTLDWDVRSKSSMLDYVRTRLNETTESNHPGVRTLFVDELGDEMLKDPRYIQCRESELMDLISACVYSLRDKFDIGDSVMSDEDRVLVFVECNWDLSRVYDFAAHFHSAARSSRWKFSLAVEEDAEEGADCPTCWCPMDRCVKLCACGHSFCRECWERQAVEMIGEQGQLAVPCLAKDCPFRLPYTVIQTFPAWEEKLNDRIIGLVNASVHKSQFFSYCPGCEERNENTVVMAQASLSDLGLPEVVCDSCRTSWCYNCRKQSHAPMSCSLNEQWEEILRSSSVHIQKIVQNIRAKKTKKCPGCGHAVQKNSGCDHIHCVCGTHWCWRCGKKPSERFGIYDHLRNCRGLKVTTKNVTTSGKSKTVDYCLFNYVTQLRFLHVESRARRRSVDERDEGLIAIQSFLFALRKILMNAFAFEAVLFGVRDIPDEVLPTNELFHKNRFELARREIDNISISICDSIFVDEGQDAEPHGATVASLKTAQYGNIVHLMKHAYRHCDNLWDAAKSLIALLRLPLVMDVDKEDELEERFVPMNERIPESPAFVEMISQKRHEFPRFYTHLATGVRYSPGTPRSGEEDADDEGRVDAMDADEEEDEQEGETVPVRGRRRRERRAAHPFERRWRRGVRLGDDPDRVARVYRRLHAEERTNFFRDTRSTDDKVASLREMGFLHDDAVLRDQLLLHAGNMNAVTQELLTIPVSERRRVSPMEMYGSLQLRRETTEDDDDDGEEDVEIDKDVVTPLEKLEFLTAMGFMNVDRNTRLLESTGGNVNTVLDILAGSPSDVRVRKRRGRVPIPAPSGADYDGAVDFVPSGARQDAAVVAFVLRRQRQRESLGKGRGEIRSGMYQSGRECRRLDYTYGLSLRLSVVDGLRKLAWMGFTDDDIPHGGEARTLVDMLFDKNGSPNAVADAIRGARRGGGEDEDMHEDDSSSSEDEGEGEVEDDDVPRPKMNTVTVVGFDDD